MWRLVAESPISAYLVAGSTIAVRDSGNPADEHVNANFRFRGRGFSYELTTNFDERGVPSTCAAWEWGAARDGIKGANFDRTLQALEKLIRLVEASNAVKDEVTK